MFFIKWRQRARVCPMHSMVLGTQPALGKQELHHLSASPWQFLLLTPFVSPTLCLAVCMCCKKRQSFEKVYLQSPSKHPRNLRCKSKKLGLAGSSER